MRTKRLQREALYIEFDDFTICEQCLKELTIEEYDYLDLTEEDIWLNEEMLDQMPNIFPEGLKCDECGATILKPYDTNKK